MSSTQMAQWMANGWVLTDEPCPQREVCGMPLLRSADSATWFCVSCDKTPAAAAPASVESSTASMSDKRSESRPTTPATSVSSTLSSPVFAPPAETEESIRRRHQSEMASAEMAKLLLKGWAMLADECINQACSRIPLMRPPKSGGEKDPRKQCVVCGNVYVDEKDANGFERLVPLIQGGSQSRQADSVSKPPVPSTTAAKGKSVDRSANDTPSLSPNASSSTQRLNDLSPVLKPKQPALAVQLPEPTYPERSRTLRPQSSDRHATLQTTAQTLDSTLQQLTGRLNSLNSQPYLDPASIAATAQAITAAVQALAEIAKLQQFQG